VVPCVCDEAHGCAAAGRRGRGRGGGGRGGGGGLDPPLPRGDPPLPRGDPPLPRFEGGLEPPEPESELGMPVIVGVPAYEAVKPELDSQAPVANVVANVSSTIIAGPSDTKCGGSPPA
jgi:hypothetical protein